MEATISCLIFAKQPSNKEIVLPSSRYHDQGKQLMQVLHQTTLLVTKVMHSFWNITSDQTRLTKYGLFDSLGYTRDLSSCKASSSEYKISKADQMHKV